MRPFTTIIGLLAVVSASPIAPSTNTNIITLETRQDTSSKEYQWARFHENSEAMKKTGMCRLYLDPQVQAVRNGTWACPTYCESIGEGGGDLGCHGLGMYKEGTTEFKDPSWINKTPDGDEFVLGECICSKKAKEKLKELTEKGLVALGQYMCAAVLQAAKTGSELMGYIPIPGPPGAIIKGFSKVAKTADKMDKAAGFNTFEKVVTEKCKLDKQWKDIDMKKLFEVVLTGDETPFDMTT